MEFKLLVVDDEERLVSALAQFFLGEGYLVRQATSGDEAVAIFDREAVDLVILDLAMPGLSGADVLRHIREKAPKMRVVILTAYPEREKEVRPLGYDAFLTKPFGMDELTRRVGDLLARKDADELKQVTMPEQLERAAPGVPLAHILIVDAKKEVAAPIIYHLRHLDDSQGVFHFVWAKDSQEARLNLFTIHPDLVLMNLRTIPAPALAIKEMQECGYRPRDYLFYFHRPPLTVEEERIVGHISGKRWEGNPWKEQDLAALTELVRKTCLEHGLVKR